MSSWLERVLGRGERSAPYGDPERVAAVERVLAGQRGMFQADGGDVQLAGVREDWVEVRLEGSCAGCASQADSLAWMLAPRLKAALPWVRGVRRAP